MGRKGSGSLYWRALTQVIFNNDEHFGCLPTFVMAGMNACFEEVPFCRSEAVLWNAICRFITLFYPEVERPL
jgi:hypothetical protein